MGFKDLKKLTKKENIIFLVLVIWSIIGLTFFQFNISFDLFGITFDGNFIYFPLLIVCVVLFLIAFFLRGDLRKLTPVSIFKGVLMLIVFVLIFVFLGQEVLLAIAYGAFIISTISYIFITGSFTMYYCYSYGEKMDGTLYKAPTVISFFVRWIVFLGGTLGSALLIYYIGNLTISGVENDLRKIISADLAILVDFVILIPTILIVIIIGLTVIAILYVFKGYLNAWLGLFFIFIAILTSYLMIKAFTGGNISALNPILDTPYTFLILYIIDIVILLISIANLIGKKAELITEKIKFIKTDAILIFLILCKVAYEFANSQFMTRHLLNTNVELLKYIGVFGLFIPLLIIAGIFGILSYKKLKDKRKQVKRFRKSAKKAKKRADKERSKKEKLENKKI